MSNTLSLPQSVKHAQDIIEHYILTALRTAGAAVDGDTYAELGDVLTDAFIDVYARLEKLETRIAALTTPPEPDYAMQDFQNRDFTAAEIVALRVTPPEPPAAERDQYRVEKRHYNPQIPTEIIAEYEMLQAATLYVNSLPLAMPYYYVVVDQKTGLSAYHRCPHGDDPKPTNHQIAADSSAPVKLSKAQRELLEKLDRGVDIRGYHYDNPRDMTFRLQSAKPINLKTVRILESAGLIVIRRDGRDDVLDITEAGKTALKGAK